MRGFGRVQIRLLLKLADVLLVTDALVPEPVRDLRKAIHGLRGGEGRGNFESRDQAAPRKLRFGLYISGRDRDVPIVARAMTVTKEWRNLPVILNAPGRL